MADQCAVCTEFIVSSSGLNPKDSVIFEGKERAKIVQAGFSKAEPTNEVKSFPTVDLLFGVARLGGGNAGNGVQTEKKGMKGEKGIDRGRA